MIVGNDVTTDSRVQKTALALADAGCQVTVIGYAPEGRPVEAVLGPVRVIRVPVPYLLRDARRERRGRRRSWSPRVGYPSREAERAARLALLARQREVQTSLGKAAALRTSGRAADAVSAAAIVAVSRGRQVIYRGRRELIRGRSAVQRRYVDRSRRYAWKAFDKAVSTSPVRANWRKISPEILDFDFAFGPVLDELAPDVIHAHDFHMVGIATNAVGRARLAGRNARWVYDAHEFVHGLPRYGGRTKRVVAAYEDLERDYIREADRVITVSEPIADELHRRYRLRRRPDVVMNIPVIAAPEDGASASLREAVGVAADVPLIVYSGGITPARGVVTIIDAMAELPGVQLAIVAIPATVTPYLQSLLDHAEQIGVSDRVHLAPPVESAQVVGYLATADAGVHPMLRDFEGHDMALPNKLFEYLHAGLPVVVSDCRAMSDFVTRAGMGEVFASGDPSALAVAVRTVLGNRERYVGGQRRDAVLLEYTWDRQAQRLRDVYREMLGESALRPEVEVHPSEGVRLETVSASRARGGAPVLGIGPANMAGQGWAWAKAVERRYPQVETEVVALRRDSLNFPADQLVSAYDFARNNEWQQQWSRRALSRWTHALLEAGRPVLGRLNGPDFEGDVAVLRDAGIAVGLVFHGSEIRNPRRHAQRYPWSPFKDPREELTARLQRQVDELAPKVAAFDGPKFFSTPDLLDDVSDGIWLPVVVDTAVWRPGPEPLQREVPLVVHAPSNQALKGTELIEPVLEKLQADGLIEYRRIESVPRDELPQLISDADVVLDHFGIGNYGVLTCEAMATGRVSISHIHERVRDRVPVPIPTLEATPETLADVLRSVLDDRDAARSLAAAGPDFVRRFHDGRHSAGVLAEFLDLPAETD
jgi:glycosyltransferase involved in cell wall biosynthesis